MEGRGQVGAPESDACTMEAERAGDKSQLHS